MRTSVRLLAAYILAANCVFASTLASDGSQADVQSKINSAVAGDIVTIPSGSFTWASQVAISGKAIHLKGNGSGRVVARSATSIAIGTGTKVFTLTTETLSVIEALKSAITNGASLRAYRTGGIISGGTPTGVVGWMDGTVTSLSGTTLTMNITSTNGSGTQGAWIFVTPAATTITHSAGANTLLSLTESTTGNIEVDGLRFVTGTGTLDYVDLVNASSGQPIYIHDCYFESTVNFDCVHSTTNRGIVWNCSFVALPISMAQLCVHLKGAPAASWTTTSTMGTLDTTGKSNLYVEDCDFHAWLNATDIDDNGRCTIRKCLFDNAAFGSHGADSSNYGMRHFEVYDSVFFRNDFSNGETMNINWWFLIRGGTGVIADNVMPAFGGSDYGGGTSVKLALWNLQFNGGPNPLWGSGIAGIQYPCPRQIGRGYTTGAGTDGSGRNVDSITFVGDLEPIYIWGNSGSYTVGLSSYSSTLAGQDDITDYVIASRDYYNDGTQRPGYVKYTYPHPLRTDAGAAASSSPVRRQRGNPGRWR